MQAFNDGKLEFHASQERLRERQAFLRWLDRLGKIDWVVHAKPPFGGPQQVLEYLGRYTHRVAISNQRLLDFDGDRVTFQYKDYRRSGQERSKEMTLDADEFIRRFLLHSLTPGFQRIRHYGILASSQKRTLLALARQLLGAVIHPLAPSREQLAPIASILAIVQPLQLCPVCRIGTMLVVEHLLPVPELPRRVKTHDTS
jgi:hypothetical protein